MNKLFKIILFLKHNNTSKNKCLKNVGFFNNTRNQIPPQQNYWVFDSTTKSTIFSKVDIAILIAFTIVSVSFPNQPLINNSALLSLISKQINFNGDSSSDWGYFKSNVGNNHIIPHNQDVLNELNNISELNCVLIDGSLIDLYGTKGDQYYHWNTDTNIGDFNCEIILVDSLTIYSDIIE